MLIWYKISKNNKMLKTIFFEDAKKHWKCKRRLFLDLIKQFHRLVEVECLYYFSLLPALTKLYLWSIKQTGHMTMLTTSPLVTIIFHRLQFALNWLWKVYCSQVSNHSPWQPRSLSCSFSNSKSLLNSASDFFPGRFSILIWHTPFSTCPNSNSNFPYLFQKVGGS